MLPKCLALDVQSRSPGDALDREYYHQDHYYERNNNQRSDRGRLPCLGVDALHESVNTCRDERCT